MPPMKRKTRSRTVKGKSMQKKYAKSSKSSMCKKKMPYACAATPGCKMTSGKKRKFCRTQKNKKHKKK